MATHEVLDRIEFETLAPNDALVIITGEGDEAWEYYFVADDPTGIPKGRIDAREPSGDEVGEINFELWGCGRWTTREQNPVQRQQRGFTPYYEGLIVGSFLFGKFEGDAERAIFDKKSQEITRVIHITAKP